MQKATQKRRINLQQKCIPRLARHFFQFSVIRTPSKESEPIELDEDAEVGIDSDETEMQPYFDQPRSSKLQLRGPGADKQCSFCSCNFPGSRIFISRILLVVVRVKNIFLLTFSFLFTVLIRLLILASKANLENRRRVLQCDSGQMRELVETGEVVYVPSHKSKRIALKRCHGCGVD